MLGTLIPRSGEDYMDRPFNVPVNSSLRALKNPMDRWDRDVTGGLQIMELQKVKHN